MLGSAARFILLASAATMVLSGPATAVPANFQAQADSYVKTAFPAAGPGAAVIVLDHGKIVFAEGQGLADVESKRAITPETPFRLGSITKQFTAAVVLQLVGEGKLSLDDPLSKFFPDWPQPGARATVRQLLNHTSGIFDFSKIPGFLGSEKTLKPMTTTDLLAVTRSRPAVADPGTRWEYNNGGYVILGAIIEKVTGTPWHQQVVERIAKPLDLKSIRYAVDAEAGSALAHGYSKDGEQYRESRRVHMSVAGAAGGLVGSVADMAKWAQALHHGKVLSPALYKEMTSPARLTTGKTETYGMGFRLRQIRGRAAFVHGGAGKGIDTDSVYIPADDIFVAVFSNTDDPQTDPSLLTRRLAALALGEPIPTFTRVSVDPASLEPLFGAYSKGGDQPTRFFSRAGKLYIGQGDEEIEVVAAGDDRFFIPRGDLTWVRFVRQANAAPVMEVHRPDLAAPQRAVRTGDAAPPLAIPASILQSYVGTYKTEVPTVTVALADGQLTIAPEGGKARPMRPVSQTEFMVEDPKMRVIFHVEADGKVNRLTMQRGARELHGQRQ